MSIAIDGLHKSFHTPVGAKIVLAGVSLFVGDGSVACLSGSNGCGKTTLLKIASTLALPDLGSVLINGVSTESPPGAARSVIGFVGSGERGFYEALSVRDNLLFFGRMHGVASVELSGRIYSLASLFGITSWLGEHIAHCSSGVRRKAAFIRAALSRPSVYLIDEFSASLDDTSRQAACAFVRAEAARGCSCLVVSHDADDCKMLEASPYILDNGLVRPA
jgi:ABC-type multidrug transport system ATPase subunit